MKKNNIHCLVINEPNDLKTTLAGLFGRWEGKVIVETVNDNDHRISNLIKKLVKNNISLLLVGNDNANSSEKNRLEKIRLEPYKNLLRRYSIDTILVSLSKKNSPLQRDLSGIESCSISLDDRINSPVFTKNLLRYTQLKRDFRLCKRMLSVTDKRNRWLVNITREPIAYLYKDTHIHANASYLSLFGFQSIAELKSTTIWDLVPQKSHHMLKKFMKKQSYRMDMQQTLLMSMNTIDKTKMRAGIRIAPAVINKTQCLQIWVHKIEENLVQKIDDIENTTPESPWENLPEKKSKSALPHRTVAKNTSGTNDIAPYTQELNRGLISVKLKLQPLTDTSHSEINHYYAKLQFDAKEQAVVTKHLREMTGIKPAVFLDRLLVTELSKSLKKNTSLNQHYFISLRATSFCDNSFMSFLLQSLKALPKKHPHLIFLIPHSLFMEQGKRVSHIKNKLRTFNSSLGLYNFVPDKVSLQKIMHDKPSHISFSSNWIHRLDGNNIQRDKFSELTDKLEDMGIEIILS